MGGVKRCAEGDGGAVALHGFGVGSAGSVGGGGERSGIGGGVVEICGVEGGEVVVVDKGSLGEARANGREYYVNMLYEAMVKGKSLKDRIMAGRELSALENWKGGRPEDLGQTAVEAWVLRTLRR